MPACGQPRRSSPAGRRPPSATSVVLPARGDRRARARASSLGEASPPGRARARRTGVPAERRRAASAAATRRDEQLERERRRVVRRASAWRPELEAQRRCPSNAPYGGRDRRGRARRRPGRPTASRCRRRRTATSGRRPRRRRSRARARSIGTAPMPCAPSSTSGTPRPPAAGRRARRSTQPTCEQATRDVSRRRRGRRASSSGPVRTVTPRARAASSGPEQAGVLGVGGEDLVARAEPDARRAPCRGPRWSRWSARPRSRRAPSSSRVERPQLVAGLARAPRSARRVRPLAQRAVERRARRVDRRRAAAARPSRR